VGKSSAINVIVGQAIARTSSTPGRTQAVNVFDLEGRLRLVDLPGYGYAKVSKSMRDDWRKLIGGYLSERPQIKLVVALIDARHPAQELDGTLLRQLGELDLPVLAAAHGLPADAVIPFSSTEKIGLDEAREAIAWSVSG
jgi:GTP-binding protein